MKPVEQRDVALYETASARDPDRLLGIRAYLAALGSHMARGGREDLACTLIVVQSIAGLAPTLGLRETGKRAQALQIFVRSIMTRDGAATHEEQSVLSRAYVRLTAAAREEGAG